MCCTFSHLFLNWLCYINCVFIHTYYISPHFFRPTHAFEILDCRTEEKEAEASAAKESCYTQICLYKTSSSSIAILHV